MLTDDQIIDLKKWSESCRDPNRAAYPAGADDIDAALAEIAALRAERDDIHRLWSDRDEREVEAGKRCGVDRDAFGVDWPEHVAAKLVSMTAERDRLAAVVAKLPKTNDDEPVVPGVVYYAIHSRYGDDDNHEWLVSPCRYVGHAEPWCKHKWEIVNPESESCDVRGVYSTEDAAEAARPKEKI